MSTGPLIRVKAYPNGQSKAVLFFICPYGTRIAKLVLPIKQLQRSGLSVVAYDVADRVIDGGDPSLLQIAVAEVTADIKDRIASYKRQNKSDFGFFGSSLGAFILYNAIAAVPELKWGVFNTGGDMAVGLWKLKKPRRRFEAAGIGLGHLSKAWRPLQYPKFKGLTGSHYLFFSSASDKLAPLKEIDRFLEPVRKAGAQVDILSVKAFGHASAVSLGLLQCRKLVRFVRDA